MIKKIVERIKTYCSDEGYPVECVEFGDKLPKAPYVVVKEERDSRGAGKAYRIVSHFSPGQQESLRFCNRTLISGALNGFQATSEAGNLNKLKKDSDSFDGRIIPNDDGTISSERLYYMADFI